MVSVEKNLTAQGVERFRNTAEFQKRQEAERKFTSTDLQQTNYLFREGALPIEQIYLSKPTSEFSLRVRRAYTPQGIQYSVTLKDRGVIEGGTLKRLEVDTPISKQAFELYAGMREFPLLRKLRNNAEPGVSVDFVDGYPLPIFEFEHADANERQRLVDKYSTLLNGRLDEETGNRALDSEALAHMLARTEIGQPPDSLDHFIKRQAHEMLAQYATGKEQVVLCLPGLPGSGKSTAASEIKAELARLFPEGPEPIVISTDDYHFGNTHLDSQHGSPWTKWDHSATYDTPGLNFDVKQLRNGIPLLRKHFDFATQEPVLDELVQPSPLIIIEGLHAGSPDLNEVRTLYGELPTDIATSIGRDARRLIIDGRANDAFPTPEDRLRYMVEEVVPMYLAMETPTSAAFSANSRVLPERAHLLRFAS